MSQVKRLKELKRLPVGSQKREAAGRLRPENSAPVAASLLLSLSAHVSREGAKDAKKSLKRCF
jgi:hypothetical protein